MKRVCVSEKWGKGRRSKRPKRKASFCFVFITCDSLGGGVRELLDGERHGIK